MKTLMLCRHAKSSWKYNTDDLYRPLNGRGINQAPLMAENLAENLAANQTKNNPGVTGKDIKGNLSLQPDLVLCSPAVRAWSTAVCYFRECGWNYNSLQINANLHEASGNHLLEELRKVPEHLFNKPINTVALFGHNPGLNDLITFLDAQNDCHPNLVTSGRVIMQLDVQVWQDLTGSCGEVKDWIVPAEIGSRRN